MNEISKVVKAGKASDQLKRDYDTLVEFTEGKIDTVEGQEKLARAFEAYLREGKAPTSRLATAFNTVADLLRRIYSGIQPDARPARSA